MQFFAHTSKPTIPKIHIDIIDLRSIKCIACEQCPSESHPRCSSDTSSGKRRHGAMPRLIPPVLRGFLCQAKGLSLISSGESAGESSKKCHLGCTWGCKHRLQLHVDTVTARSFSVIHQPCPSVLTPNMGH